MPRRSTAIFTLALAIVVAPARAATPAGTVAAVTGECFLETGEQHRPLNLGDQVNTGDTVAVPDNARLKLRLGDGSFVSAASGTRLTIAAFTADAQHRDAQLSLPGGLLRIVVAAAAGQSRFEIATATGSAEAASGDFFIAATPEATQLGVLAGTVSLKSRANGHGVAVVAHKSARLDAGKDPVQRAWTPQEIAAVTDRTEVK